MKKTWLTSQRYSEVNTESWYLSATNLGATFRKPAGNGRTCTHELSGGDIDVVHPSKASSIVLESNGPILGIMTDIHIPRLRHFVDNHLIVGRHCVRF